MTDPISAQDLFKGRHFDKEIIVLCIRWYLAFKLSSRDLVQMMAERGIALAHTTILSKDYELKVQTSEAFIDLAGHPPHAQTARPEVKLLKHPLRCAKDRQAAGPILFSLCRAGPAATFSALCLLRLQRTKLLDTVRFTAQGGGLNASVFCSVRHDHCDHY